MTPPLPIPPGLYPLDGLPPSAGHAWVQVRKGAEIPSSLHLDSTGGVYLKSSLGPGVSILQQPKEWRDANLPADIRAEVKKMMGQTEGASTAPPDAQTGQLPSKDYRTNGILQSQMPTSPIIHTNDNHFLDSMLASAAAKHAPPLQPRASAQTDIGFDRLLRGAGFHGADASAILLAVALVVIGLVIALAALIGGRAGK